VHFFPGLHSCPGRVLLGTNLGGVTPRRFSFVAADPNYVARLLVSGFFVDESRSLLLCDANLSHHVTRRQLSVRSRSYPVMSFSPTGLALSDHLGPIDPLAFGSQIFPLASNDVRSFPNASPGSVSVMPASWVLFADAVPPSELFHSPASF